jgi:hypothetical protein
VPARRSGSAVAWYRKQLATRPVVQVGIEIPPLVATPSAFGSHTILEGFDAPRLGSEFRKVFWLVGKPGARRPRADLGRDLGLCSSGKERTSSGADDKRGRKHTAIDHIQISYGRKICRALQHVRICPHSSSRLARQDLSHL